jgi:hypothetical protein
MGDQKAGSFLVTHGSSLAIHPQMELLEKDRRPLRIGAGIDHTVDGADGEQANLQGILDGKLRWSRPVGRRRRLQCLKLFLPGSELLFQIREAGDHNPIGRAVGFQKPLLQAVSDERGPIQLQPADVKHAGLGEPVQCAVVGERHVSAEIISLWMKQAL